MLGLNQIVDIAQAIQMPPQVHSIAITRERCTRYRHQASTCSRCVDVCPSAAVNVSQNYPALDAGLCTECGACASICQTEAIAMIEPDDKELSENIVAQVRQHSSVALACKQASPMSPDTLVVTCLARLDLSMIVLAIAKRAAEVSLVTGNCSECNSGATLPYLCNTVAAAEALTQALCGHTRISLRTSTPAEVSMPVEEDVDLSRRSFFTKLGKESTGYTAKAATVFLSGTSHTSALQTNDAVVRREDLAIHLPDKRVRFVDSLRELEAQTTAARGAAVLFSIPKLDATQCIGCAMCADLCPTGALAAKEEEGMLRITCNASDCVACKLCVDACPRRAVTLRPDDEGSVDPIRAIVLEQHKNADLLAPAEDKMGHLLGVSLYRT